MGLHQWNDPHPGHHQQWRRRPGPIPGIPHMSHYHSELRQLSGQRATSDIDDVDGRRRRVDPISPQQSHGENAHDRLQLRLERDRENSALLQRAGSPDGSVASCVAVSPTVGLNFTATTISKTYSRQQHILESDLPARQGRAVPTGGLISSLFAPSV